MGKGSGKQKVKVVKGIGLAVANFDNLSNKRLVAKNIKNSNKIKSTKNIVAYNPRTSSYVYGTLAEVSKQIKSTPSTLKTRIKKDGKLQYQDIKGYTIIPFDNIEKVVAFKNSLVNDSKSKKKKWEPIVEGMSLIEAQEPSYKLKQGSAIKNKFWGTSEQRFSIDLKDNALTEDAIEGIFNDSIKSVKKSEKLKSNDKMRIIIEDPNLKFFVSTQLMNAGELSSTDIQELISEVVESNQDWTIGPQTIISVVSINIPEGAGGSNFNSGWKGGSSKNKIDPVLDENDKVLPTDFKLKEQALKKFNKKSIIQINNPNDELCCARAIGLAIVRNELGAESPEYKQMVKDRKHSQYKRAKTIHKKAGVPKGRCGIEEIKKFEESTGYSICVIDGDFMNQVVYPEVSKYQPNNDTSKNIYLYKTGEHYDLIASNRVAGFFSRDHFCHRCKATYKMKEKHRCRFKCNMCCRAECPVLDIPLRDRKYDNQCEDCKRWFCNSL